MVMSRAEQARDYARQARKQAQQKPWAASTLEATAREWDAAAKKFAKEDGE